MLKMGGFGALGVSARPPACLGLRAGAVPRARVLVQSVDGCGASAPSRVADAFECTTGARCARSRVLGKETLCVGRGDVSINVPGAGQGRRRLDLAKRWNLNCSRRLRSRWVLVVVPPLLSLAARAPGVAPRSR